MNYFKVEKLKRIANREVFAYVVGGFVTTLFNFILFYILLKTGMDYKIANIVSLIFGKIFTFIVNKIFVFKSRTSNFMELLCEVWRFIYTRAVSTLMDVFGMVLLVSGLGFDPMYSKYMLFLLIVTTNFFLGRKIVFKNKTQ